MYRKIPFVSTMLVIVNVIVFLICTFTGNLLYNMGRLDIISVLVYGEYGRIFSAMFLHSGINHIFNNMVILFFLGSLIEKEVGHIRYALLYFLAGVGGNIISLAYKIVTYDFSGSIGASGAVFGLDGALLALILLSDKRVENVTPTRVVLMIVYSLYSGFTGANIDNAAHVGGLLTGFLVMVVMCLADNRKTKKKNERCSFEY